MTVRRSAARELVDLGLTLAGEAVSRTLNALIPSNAERRARAYLTTLAPTVDNGFSPADIEGIMTAAEAPEPCIEWVSVASIYALCSYPMRPVVVACSDTCQRSAVTAVQPEGSDRYMYRCLKHTGFVDAHTQGAIFERIPQALDRVEEPWSDDSAEQFDIPRVRNGHLIMAAQTSAPPAGEPTGAGTSPSGTGEARPVKLAAKFDRPDGLGVAGLLKHHGVPVEFEPAEKATSALLTAAANQLEKARHATGSIGYLYLGELIPELRERAAMFEKIENEETEA